MPRGLNEAYIELHTPPGCTFQTIDKPDSEYLRIVFENKQYNYRKCVMIFKKNPYKELASHKAALIENYKIFLRFKKIEKRSQK